MPFAVMRRHTHFLDPSFHTPPQFTKMKIITFGSAAVLAAVITSAILARPSLAEIESCCKTQVQKAKVEQYILVEPTGKAATAMARHYANTAGGPVDEAQALFWYRHAAEKGFPEAIARVGAFTANAAIKPCYDAEAATEARELLSNSLLQSPQWTDHVTQWLTTLQTARASIPACASTTIAAAIPPTLSSATPSK